MIETDQGIIPVETVTTKNTINGYQVSGLTKCPTKNNFILIKKNAFGENRNIDTISTKQHGIYVNDTDEEFVRLLNLVNGDTVVKVEMERSLVYNIGLESSFVQM